MGQTPMPILGRTSTMEADHYGHAGIDPHDELGWTPIVSSDHNGCDGLDLDELGSHGWVGPPRWGQARSPQQGWTPMMGLDLCGHAEPHNGDGLEPHGQAGPPVVLRWTPMAPLVLHP